MCCLFINAKRSAKYLQPGLATMLMPVRATLLSVFTCRIVINIRAAARWDPVLRVSHLDESHVKASEVVERPGHIFNTEMLELEEGPVPP